MRATRLIWKVRTTTARSATTAWPNGRQFLQHTQSGNASSCMQHPHVWCTGCCGAITRACYWGSPRAQIRLEMQAVKPGDQIAAAKHTCGVHQGLHLGHHRTSKRRSRHTRRVLHAFLQRRCSHGTVSGAATQPRPIAPAVSCDTTHALAPAGTRHARRPPLCCNRSCCGDVASPVCLSCNVRCNRSRSRCCFICRACSSRFARPACTHTWRHSRRQPPDVETGGDASRRGKPQPYAPVATCMQSHTHKHSPLKGFCRVPRRLLHHSRHARLVRCGAAAAAATHSCARPCCVAAGGGRTAPLHVCFCVCTGPSTAAISSSGGSSWVRQRHACQPLHRAQVMCAAGSNIAS
jgi:hypothetical protein